MMGRSGHRVAIRLDRCGTANLVKVDSTAKRNGSSEADFDVSAKL